MRNLSDEFLDMTIEILPTDIEFELDLTCK